MKRANHRSYGDRLGSQAAAGYLRALMVMLMLMTVGCANETIDAEAADKSRPDCVDTRTFFDDEVWSRFMADTCLRCHNAQGVARLSDLVLRSENQPNFLDHNLSILEKLAVIQVKGQPLLVQKARGGLDHGGGAQLTPGSAGDRALAGLVARVENPVVCDGTKTAGVAGATADDLSHKIVLLSPAASFRRACLALVGRLPNAVEVGALAAEGEAALPRLIDGLLVDEAFIQQVQAWYGDRLLLDRYLGGSNATNLLDAKDFPQRRWYDNKELEPDSDLRKLGKAVVNDRIAREPLALIGWILRQKRPFSDILTADHMVLDPLSARVYGAQGDFKDTSDSSARVAVKVPGFAHAGILTSPMFLNRFPTTATNRNRHRSRTVYDLFLATDILRLGERPIDPAQIVDHNPTLFNPDCTVCHTVMDPVAGAFQNWDELGRLRPPKEGWFTSLLPPGFGKKTLPSSETPTALRWLGKRIVADDRFAISIVHTLFMGLMGRRPLVPPAADDPAFKPKKSAWKLENAEIRAAAIVLRNNGLELRVAARYLVLSPLFRLGGVAQLGGVTRETQEIDVQALALLGADRWLTPEELDRKLVAALGNSWARYDKRSYLLHDYKLLYGGMDAKDVIRRIRSPNGVMIAIVRRFANELACCQVAADFVRKPGARRLFPLVEMSYAPDDANGFPIAGARAAIRANIGFLHQRLLGEQLNAKDDEIERTWQLFYATWKEGRELLQQGEKPGGASTYLHSVCRATVHPDSGETLVKSARIERDPDYIVRAWMAVITYLLSDYRFLHQ